MILLELIEITIAGTAQAELASAAKTVHLPAGLLWKAWFQVPALDNGTETADVRIVPAWDSGATLLPYTAIGSGTCADGVTTAQDFGAAPVMLAGTDDAIVTVTASAAQAASRAFKLWLAVQTL